MLHVSIIVELLRSQPRLVFWFTALSQAALWWLAPSLFYSAPPGDLPMLLAVGHEFQLGTLAGPPLASWFAEIAFWFGGMPGVYLLSQICVIVTYWAVFTLGCATVGMLHAALAVMLMVGIAVMSIPTPEFGPSVLAMAMLALLYLHFWRAVGEGKRTYWLAVGVETGLLLMTSYAGIIPCVMLVLFTAGTARGRAALSTLEPWIAGVVAVILMFPHLIWLDSTTAQWSPSLARMFTLDALNTNIGDFFRMLVRVVALHAGFVGLIAFASRWRLRNVEERVPVFLRAPVDPFARLFIYYHALAPVLIASVISVTFGERGLFGGTAPLVILSGLAAVVFAGDIISLHRQRLVGFMWVSWLAVPPVFALLLLVTVPWIAGVEFAVSQPAPALGQFFSENFQRRTGKPLEIVAGDPQLASLVALYASPRARLYADGAPEQSPWITKDDIVRKGAVVVWVATDTAGTPPAEIKARFPTLVPDVPRAFSRLVQGRTPLLRVGWGMLRPGESLTPPPAAPAAIAPVAPTPAPSPPEITAPATPAPANARPAAPMRPAPARPAPPR